MKKKIALLLALSMVLSMIPVTAFGATGDPYLSGGRPAQIMETASGNDLKLTAKVVVPFDYLWNGQNDDVKFYFDFNEHTAASAVPTIEVFDNNGTLVTTTPSPIVMTGVTVSTTGANFRGERGTVNTTVEDFSGMVGRGYYCIITVPYWADNKANGKDGDAHNAVVTITPFGQNTSSPKKDITLATRYNKEVYYSVSYGDPVTFGDVAVLEDFVIKENYIDALPANSWVLLKMTIENPYISWANVKPKVANVSPRDSGLYMYPSGDPVDVGAFLRADKMNKNNIAPGGEWQIAYVAVKIGADSSGTRRLPGSFKLQGLSIVADDKAKFDDVDVTVEWFAIGQASSSTDTLDEFEAATSDDDFIIDDDTFTVATYDNYAIQLKLQKDVKLTDFELFSGDYDVATAGFSITELTPNAFPTSRSSNLALNFNVPEGVKIVSAKVSLYNVTNASDPKDVFKDVKVELNDPTHIEGIRVTPDTLYVSPYIKRDDRNNELFEIRVNLNLSIQNGVADELDNEILIGISGSGVDGVTMYDTDGKTKLTGSDRGIVVATVEDRIELSTTPVEFGITGIGAYAAYKEIGPIVITEVEEGYLEFGTIIHLFVETPRPEDVRLTAGKPFVDTKSGLKISEKWRDAWGITFEVTRESDDGPGTITIPDGLISGFIYPGIQYSVSVYNEGDSYSANDEDNSRNRSTAYFDETYESTLFVFSGETPITVPGEGGVVGPGTPGRIESASFGSETIMTSDGPLSNPFRTNLPGTVGDTGYLALRSFELLGFEVTWLGGNQSRIYDPFTNQTLTYYIGSEIGYLDGAPVTFVNNDGVPAKVLQATVDGEIRTFLPARTVASLFGYTVDCPAPYTTIYLNLTK